jgi:hypothetical protein
LERASALYNPRITAGWLLEPAVMSHITAGSNNHPAVIWDITAGWLLEPAVILIIFKHFGSPIDLKWKSCKQQSCGTHECLQLLF